MIFGKQFNRYYLKYALPLLVGILTLVAVDFFQLIIPNLYQMVINGINDGSVVVDGEAVPFDMAFLLGRICLPFIGIILVIMVGRFVWRIAFLGSSIGVVDDLMKRMFGNAKDLSRDYYHENKVGSLMSLFTNDLETIRECFGWGVLMFFDALLLGVLAITKMFRMNATLTVLTLIPMGFLLAAATVVGKYMMDKWEVRQEAFSKLSDFSQESFSGIAVIKAFVKEARELWAFKRLNQNNEKANITHTKASVLLRVLVTLFVESIICVILGYGGYLVYLGTFNAGQLVEFIGYFTAIIWPIMAVSELIDMTSRGRASLKRVSALLNEKPSVHDREGAVPIGEIKGKIEFKNLTFRFPKAHVDALTDVSFVIEPGEHVGLFGKTGAGKTTITNLINRFYDIADGKIRDDGININKIRKPSLRRSLGMVLQDTVLFTGTVMDNIRYGRLDATDEECIQAAKLSGADSFITLLPQGYQTMLAGDGSNLSQGQCQLLAIARAAVADPPVMILDEATSSIDTRTEQIVSAGMDALMQGRTVFVIAHRLSTVKNANVILVLDHGRVIERGTHDELIAAKGQYYQLYTGAFELE